MDNGIESPKEWMSDPFWGTFQTLVWAERDSEPYKGFLRGILMVLTLKYDSLHALNALGHKIVQAEKDKKDAFNKKPFDSALIRKTSEDYEDLILQFRDLQNEILYESAKQYPETYTENRFRNASRND